MVTSVMDRDRRVAILPALAVGFSLLLGGGGSPAPLPELILQLITALLLGAWAAMLAIKAYLGEPATRLSRPAVLFTIAFFAIPIIQLVPLPPIDRKSVV